MSTYIADDSKVCERIKNREPDANVLCLLCDGAASLAHKLVSIQSYLHPVVE